MPQSPFSDVGGRPRAPGRFVLAVGCRRSSCALSSRFSRAVRRPAALVDELGRETAQRRAQSLGAKLEFSSW